jgi:protein-tyrosine-phosphatase
MAEGIFNSMTKKARMEDLFISISAGVYAMDKQSASPNAVITLKEMDIDISKHKAQSVTPELVEESDFIITMTGEHKNELIKRFSYSVDKIFTFHEMAHDDTSRNVDDPYGLELKHYKLCANELKDGMKIIFDKVLNDNK